MWCQSIAGLTILLLSYLTDYKSVLIVYLINNIAMVPTIALVNAIVFHYIDDSHNFGKIRLWGTIGWIAAGWLMSFIWQTEVKDYSLALKLSAGFSLIVILLTYKLPKLQLDRSKTVTIIPYDAIKVIKRQEIAVMLLLILLMCTSDRFMQYGIPLYLSSKGVSQDKIIFFLSFGQLPEIFMLFSLGYLLKKISFKTLFLIPFSLQVTRYLLYWGDLSLGFTLVAITIHGFVFALFYAAASIYVDKFTSLETRGGVHQIFSMIQVGVAGLIGNYFAGWIAEFTLPNGEINFKLFWSIPVVMSITAFIIMVLFLKRVPKE